MAFNPLMTLEDVKRDHVTKMIEHCSGNKHEACRNLGITVKTLYNMLHKYGLFEKYKRKPWGRDYGCKSADGDDGQVQRDPELLGGESQGRTTQFGPSDFP